MSKHNVQHVFDSAQKHFGVEFKSAKREWFDASTRAKEMAILYAMSELKANYEDIMNVIDIDRTTISLLRSFARGNMQANAYRATYEEFIQTL